MKKPEHIICDLSEVMILGLGGDGGPLGRGLGLDPDRQYAAFSGPHLINLLKGLCTESYYLGEVIRVNGWKIESSKLERLIRANFEVANEKTISLIRRLAKSFRLTLLSDHAREWVDSILELHPFIEELFSTRIFSFQTGAIKSEPAMFESALSKIGANPGDCLFIDDSLANVECARKLGIEAIRYTDAARLEMELENRNILR